MTSDPPSRVGVRALWSRWAAHDRQQHPLEQGLPFVALGLGGISVISLVVQAWDAAAWSGIAGGLVAAYGEFIATTTAERWIALAGFVLSLVGVAVSMAHGALL